MSRVVVFALLLPTLLLGFGCDSLSEFEGTFSGKVVAGSFVRSCFPAETTAKLIFTPSSAIGPVEDVDKRAHNWLTLRSKDGEVLFDAELDPIGSLAGDTLADFDFPGQKRLRNFLLLARPSDGVLAGRDALVVVSLLATKHVELRVIARGGDDEPACSEPEGDEDSGLAASARPEYYGLFKLK